MVLHLADWEGTDKLSYREQQVRNDIQCEPDLITDLGVDNIWRVLEEGRLPISLQASDSDIVNSGEGHGRQGGQGEERREHASGVTSNNGHRGRRKN